MYYVIFVVLFLIILIYINRPKNKEYFIISDTNKVKQVISNSILSNSNTLTILNNPTVTGNVYDSYKLKINITAPKSSGALPITGSGMITQSNSPSSNIRYMIGDDSNIQKCIGADSPPNTMQLFTTVGGIDTQPDGQLASSIYYKNLLGKLFSVDLTKNIYQEKAAAISSSTSKTDILTKYHLSLSNYMNYYVLNAVPNNSGNKSANGKYTLELGVKNINT